MIERRLTMTVQEAAEVIGISRTSAYLCAARGELPTRRFGRRVLVLVAPFLAMLDDDSGRLNAAGDRHNDQDPWDLRQLEGTSSCSAQVTTSSTERLCPK